MKLNTIIKKNQGPCTACHNRGWILANNDTHGLRIERCDACKLLASDDVAVTVVTSHAIAWENQAK